MNTREIAAALPDVRLRTLLKAFKRPAGPERRVRHVAVSVLPDPQVAERDA